MDRFTRCFRRRFLAGMACGLLIAGITAGCGGGTSSQSGVQEVEFWTMQLQPKFTDYFDQLIAEFEAANPDIDVVWVDVPWADMQSKILTAVSAGTAPDVVNLNPDFASQLAGRNAWLSLDERVTPEQQAVYLPKIWEATTLDGESFGFPWYLTARVTLYNADIFEQSGIAEPPSTFEELAAAARQIKAATGKYAFFISFVPEDAADVMQSFVQMGVPLLDEAGQAAFDTPAGEAVFQYWTDLYQQDLLPREVLTQGHRRAIELYQAGEVAILSSGAEALDNIANNAPDIAASTESAPQITGSTGKKNVAAMNLVIPRSTDVPEAAVQFALYITNEENQRSFAQAANVLPSTAAAAGDFAAPPADATSIQAARAVSASQLADAEVLIPAREDIKELQKILYDNLQAAMLGDKSVAEAVDDAAAEWNSR